MQNIPISFRRVAIFLGIFILAWLVIEFNSRLQGLNLRNEQRVEVRVAATQASQTEMALQTQVAYAASTEAVEEWARTEGHYIMEGDQPVVPIGKPGSEPVIAPTPIPTATPIENWEVWMKLFFDE